jgi:tRNA-dihydrouridine synthase A
MMGRAAYHTPAQLLAWDLMIDSNGEQFGYFLNEHLWQEIIQKLIAYAQEWFDETETIKEGSFYLAAITRHVLGFAHGLSGSRYWRQQLSDHRLLSGVRSKNQIEDFFLEANQKLRMFSQRDLETYESYRDDE